MIQYITQLRRGWKDDTRDDWTEYEAQENHLKPSEGELVVEYDHGVPKFKIGDGVSEFSQLPYVDNELAQAIGQLEADIENIASPGTLVINSQEDWDRELNNFHMYRKIIVDTDITLTGGNPWWMPSYTYKVEFDFLNHTINGNGLMMNAIWENADTNEGVARSNTIRNAYFFNCYPQYFEKLENCIIEKDVYSTNNLYNCEIRGTAYGCSNMIGCTANGLNSCKNVMLNSYDGVTIISCTNVFNMEDISVPGAEVDMSFDNTGTNLEATTIDGAIRELANQTSTDTNILTINSQEEWDVELVNFHNYKVINVLCDIELLVNPAWFMPENVVDCEFNFFGHTIQNTQPVDRLFPGYFTGVSADLADAGIGTNIIKNAHFSECTPDRFAKLENCTMPSVTNVNNLYNCDIEGTAIGCNNLIGCTASRLEYCNNIILNSYDEVTMTSCTNVLNIEGTAVEADISFDNADTNIEATTIDGAIRELANVAPVDSGTLTLYGDFTYSLYFDIRSDSWFEVSYAGRKELYRPAIHPDKVRVTIDGKAYPCEEIVIKGYITSFWADTSGIKNVKADKLDTLTAFKYNNWRGEDTLCLDGMPNLEWLRLIDSPITKLKAEKMPQVKTLIKLNNDGKDITPISITPKMVPVVYEYGNKFYKPNDKLYLSKGDNIQNLGIPDENICYVDETKSESGDGFTPATAFNSFTEALNGHPDSYGASRVIRLLSDATYDTGSQSVWIDWSYGRDGAYAYEGTLIIESDENAHSRRRLKIKGSQRSLGIPYPTIFRNIVLVGDGSNYTTSMKSNAGYFTSLWIRAKTLFENVDSYTLPIVCDKPGALIEGVNSRFGMIRYGTTGWNHGASTNVNGNVTIELKNCTVHRLNCSACGYTDGDASGNYGAGTINGSLTIFADNSTITNLTSPSVSKPTTITDGLYLYSLNGSVFPTHDFVVTNGTHNRTLEIYGGWAEVKSESNSSIYLYSDHPRRYPTVINEAGEENARITEDNPWEWEISDGITVVDFNKTLTQPLTKTEWCLGGYISPYEQIILPEPDVVNPYFLTFNDTIEQLFITTNNTWISFRIFSNLKNLSLKNSKNLTDISFGLPDSISIIELTGIPAATQIIEGLCTFDDGITRTIYMKGITQEEIAAINVPEGWVIEDNEFNEF